MARPLLLLLAGVLTLLGCGGSRVEPPVGREGDFKFNAVPRPPEPPSPRPPPSAQEWRQMHEEEKAAFALNFKPPLSPWPEGAGPVRVTLYRLGALTEWNGDEKPRRKPPRNLFHGWRVSETVRMADRRSLENLLVELNKSENYSVDHEGCLSPGMGISIRGPGIGLDAVVCLGCRHFLLTHVADLSAPLDEDDNTLFLSSEGVRYYAGLFNEAFPAHAIPKDELATMSE